MAYQNSAIEQVFNFSDNKQFAILPLETLCFAVNINLSQNHILCNVIFMSSNHPYQQ